MHVQVIAIYPSWQEDWAAIPSVKLRMRKGERCAQVSCRVMEAEGQFMAMPVWDTPPGLQPPTFKFRIEVSREDRTSRRSVVLILQAVKSGVVDDPEHRILAPLVNNGLTLIYEFFKAEVVHADSSGRIEVRVMVIDSSSGRLGTRP